jgi:GntR family transcriptional regulator, rspAB operon transcriptional repressor
MQIRPRQKANQIYELLRRSIIMLELAPGSPIVERELCAAYEVSRTPLREAAQRLAEEGLIVIVPHSGTYVSRISYKTAEEGFLIRRALEVEGVRRASINVDERSAMALDAIILRMQEIISSSQLLRYLEQDDALHATLAGMSGLSRLWKFISMAKVDLDRMRQLSATVPGHLANVTEQHAAIVDAVKRGKSDQAELAMRIHLESSFEVMSSLFNEGAGIFLEGET